MADLVDKGDTLHQLIREQLAERVLLVLDATEWRGK